ncbi:hypothetical protein RchiOBHm_Chr7g0243271 [Rosa chinensis]|uniref:Uncharacterized protein n=1 Tax=Rosa chinensis TaxID=74649 RepID=A0A2P6PIP7_ROSCH|nr:hypothetical protein RchiOBHm_Chr7g0243271 [Rosa chinensis]
MEYGSEFNDRSSGLSRRALEFDVSFCSVTIRLGRFGTEVGIRSLPEFLSGLKVTKIWVVGTM